MYNHCYVIVKEPMTYELSSEPRIKIQIPTMYCHSHQSLPQLQRNKFKDIIIRIENNLTGNNRPSNYNSRINNKKMAIKIFKIRCRKEKNDFPDIKIEDTVTTSRQNFEFNIFDNCTSS